MARRAKPWYRAGEDCWYTTWKGRQVSLGVRGKDSEAEAWRVWVLLRGRGGSAELKKDEPTQVAACPGGESADRGSVKVGDVIQAFLDDATGRVSPDTRESYRLFLLAFSRQYKGLPAAAMTPTTAEAYSRKPNWNDSTRSCFLSILSRAFRHAERARLIDRTPLIGLRKPRVGSRAADVLITPQEHEKLLAASPLPFQQFLRVLHGTGCRPGEAAKIEAPDIDWEAATVAIRKHKTAHHGKRRVLYLSAAMVALLRPLAEIHPSGALLRNRIGKKWTKANIGMSIRKAARKAGVSRKIAYGYRHTYATDALADGIPDAVVAELLGHSSTAMLHKHYSHLATRGKVLWKLLSGYATLSRAVLRHPRAPERRYLWFSGGNPLRSEVRCWRRGNEKMCSPLINSGRPA